MTNRLKEMGESAAWQLMVGAARRGAEKEGYVLTRQPGRGLSNTWRMDKDGGSSIASIRTTRDRWVAFPPLEGGAKWKTLDDVQQVLVAAVDKPENPQNVDVYLFPADEVRRRFDASYAARMKAGHTVRDNYGMWIKLDAGDPNVPSQVGAGLVDDYPAIAHFSLDELQEDQPPVDAAIHPDATELEGVHESAAPALSTVGDVMAFARAQIAQLTNMTPEAIKLDLKIEY